MKRTAIAAALAAAATLAASGAQADEAKHLRIAPYPYVAPAPVYVRPVAPVVHAPVVRYATPVVNHRYVPVNNHRHFGHNHGGYWRNGRWIAPVVIGAAVLGTVAAANHYYNAPAVTYVNPAPTYVTPVVTVPANCDTFCQADRDQNGVVDKVEASYDRTWERWFYDIDRNNDGVITRGEIADWNRLRATGRY